MQLYWSLLLLVVSTGLILAEFFWVLAHMPDPFEWRSARGRRFWALVSWTLPMWTLVCYVLMRISPQPVKEAGPMTAVSLTITVSLALALTARSAYYSWKQWRIDKICAGAKPRRWDPTSLS